jgi:hypothetical protein
MSSAPRVACRLTRRCSRHRRLVRTPHIRFAMCGSMDCGAAARYPLGAAYPCTALVSRDAFHSATFNSLKAIFGKPPLELV